MPQSKSPVLELRTQAFIEAVAAQRGEPLYKLSYPAARQVLEDLQAAPVAKLPADVEEKVLSVGPNGEVPVRIYRPQESRDPLPVVMNFHGGGRVLGSKNTHDRLLRDLAKATNATFVFVSHAFARSAIRHTPLSRPMPQLPTSPNMAGS
jgi:acetyl esterase